MSKFFWRDWCRSFIRCTNVFALIGDKWSRSRRLKIRLVKGGTFCQTCCTHWNHYVMSDCPPLQHHMSPYMHICNITFTFAAITFAVIICNETFTSNAHLRIYNLRNVHKYVYIFKTYLWHLIHWAPRCSLFTCNHTKSDYWRRKFRKQIQKHFGFGS